MKAAAPGAPSIGAQLPVGNGPKTITGWMRDAVMRLNAGRTLYATTVTSAAALCAGLLSRSVLLNSSKGATTSIVGAAKQLVPIRSVGSNHRERICGHLMSLNARDRYLRFGYAAKDEHIAQYVAGLDFERDEIFGIYDRSLLLIAVAHLAYGIGDICDSGAEFGVSVLSHARERGYGTRLFEHAAMHASNKGISRIFINALSENQAMLLIATHAGARVKRRGCESEAFLQLPLANLGSRLTEFVEERVAQTDYRIKLRTRRVAPTA